MYMYIQLINGSKSMFDVPSLLIRYCLLVNSQKSENCQNYSHTQNRRQIINEKLSTHFHITSSIENY